MLRQLADVFSQAGFVSGGGVFVDDAFVNGLVDQGHRRIEQFSARILVARAEGRTKFLDLCAQFTAVCTVDLVSFCVLTNSLNC